MKQPIKKFVKNNLNPINFKPTTMFYIFCISVYAFVILVSGSFAEHVGSAAYYNNIDNHTDIVNYIFVDNGPNLIDDAKHNLSQLSLFDFTIVNPVMHFGQNYIENCHHAARNGFIYGYENPRMYYYQIKTYVLTIVMFLITILTWCYLIINIRKKYKHFNKYYFMPVAVIFSLCFFFVLSFLLYLIFFSSIHFIIKTIIIISFFIWFNLFPTIIKNMFFFLKININIKNK